MATSIWGNRRLAGVAGFMLLAVHAAGTPAAATTTATATATAPAGTTVEDDAFAMLGSWRRFQIASVIPDLRLACAPAGSALATTATQAEIRRASRTLAASPVGAWLLAQATWREVLICHDPATDMAAYYRAGMRLIGVLASLPEASKVVFLAHELAHVLQHPRFSNNRRFGAEAMILLNRVREAAAEAIATRTLWQLRRAGTAAPWEAKLASAYGDVARAFAGAISRAGDGPEAELRATRAAYDRWFAQQRRVSLYDRRILAHLGRIARDWRGLQPATRPLTERFLTGIGWHAGATFLRSDQGRRLMDPYYADRLSATDAARLAAILQMRSWSPRGAVIP